jgi:hypothetical protein
MADRRRWIGVRRALRGGVEEGGGGGGGEDDHEERGAAPDEEHRDQEAGEPRIDLEVAAGGERLRGDERREERDRQELRDALDARCRARAPAPTGP